MELGYIKELTIGFIYAIMDEDKAMKKKQHIQKTNSFIEIIYTIPKQDRFGYLDVLNKEQQIRSAQMQYMKSGLCRNVSINVECLNRR